MTKLIEVDHLVIRTPKFAIIDDLSFSLEAGDFLSIEGPSGSGKSTVLKFLAQLLATNLEVSGQYTFNGRNVMEWDPMELRQEVSYCFQNPVLLADTVRDNFEFVYQIHHQTFDEDRCLQMLEKVKLSPSYINKANSDLSGGEKQRVALVRNLLFPPKVLLLDEVSSALDKSTREIIWDFLYELKEENDMTFVMISHTQVEQDKADRHIVLEAINHQDSKENHQSQEKELNSNEQ